MMLETFATTETRLSSKYSSPLLYSPEVVSIPSTLLEGESAQCGKEEGLSKCWNRNGILKSFHSHLLWFLSPRLCIPFARFAVHSLHHWLRSHLAHMKWFCILNILSSPAFGLHVANNRLVWEGKQSALSS